MDCARVVVQRCNGVACDVLSRDSCSILCDTFLARDMRDQCFRMRFVALCVQLYLTEVRMFDATVWVVAYRWPAGTFTGQELYHTEAAAIAACAKIQADEQFFADASGNEALIVAVACYKLVSSNEVF